MIFLSSETKYDPVTVTGGTLCCDDGMMVWRYKVDSYINLDLVISYNLMLKVLGFFHNINRQQQQVLTTWIFFTVKLIQKLFILISKL